jgi:hypothetical protein
VTNLLDTVSGDDPEDKLINAYLELLGKDRDDVEIDSDLYTGLGGVSDEANDWIEGVTSHFVDLNDNYDNVMAESMLSTLSFTEFEIDGVTMAGSEIVDALARGNVVKEQVEDARTR